MHEREVPMRTEVKQTNSSAIITAVHDPNCLFGSFQ